MAAVSVRWTRRALRQIEEAYAYLHERNPAAADAVMLRVDQALDALPSHPEMGKPGRIEGTRELTVTGTPFIVPYRMREGRIEILAFLHAARKWPGSL